MDMSYSGHITDTRSQGGVTCNEAEQSVTSIRLDALIGPPTAAGLPGRDYSVAVRARSRTPAVVPTYMSRVMR